MAINRKRFLTVFLVANLLLLGVGASIVAAGVGVAVPTAGVGGFSVTFDELQGEGFEQSPTIESHDECEAYPSNVAQIESGTITGLHMFKDVESPVSDDTIRVSIEADDVDFQGLDQRFTYLEGDLAFEEGQDTVYEGSSLEDAMSISAPAVTISDGQIKAQAQYIDQLSLSGSTVGVDVNPDDEGVQPPTDDLCLQEGNNSSEDGE